MWRLSAFIALTVAATPVPQLQVGQDRQSCDLGRTRISQSVVVLEKVSEDRKVLGLNTHQTCKRFKAKKY